MKLRFNLGTRDGVLSLRMATSSFGWVVLTSKVASWHLDIYKAFSTTRSSPSQGEVGIPRQAVSSIQPCPHLKAFAAKAILSTPSPQHDDAGLSTMSAGHGGTFPHF